MNYLLERVHHLWAFVRSIDLVHCRLSCPSQPDYLFVVEYQTCRRSMKNEIPLSQNDNQSTMA